MTRSLLLHLWRSASVRKALGVEVLRLVIFLVVFIGSGVAVRLASDRALGDRLYDLLIGAATIFVFWLVQMVRTARQSLREHDLL